MFSRLFRGTLAGIRTRDLPLRRRTLYPAELQVHFIFQCGRTLTLFDTSTFPLGGGRSILLSYGDIYQ